jgi:hypothetical protein
MIGLYVEGQGVATVDWFYWEQDWRPKVELAMQSPMATVTVVNLPSLSFVGVLLMAKKLQEKGKFLAGKLQIDTEEGQYTFQGRICCPCGDPFCPNRSLHMQQELGIE